MDLLLLHVLESLKFRQELLKHQSCLLQLFSFEDLESSNSHQELIKFLSRSVNASVIAFLPPEEFHLLQKYLLQFQATSSLPNEVSKKMQHWSSLLLRHFASVPKYITRNYPFLANCNLSNVLQKVPVLIEKDYEKLKNYANVNAIEKIACEIGKIFLPSAHIADNPVASCLKIFIKILNHRLLKESTLEFLEEILEKFEAGVLNEDSLLYILLLACSEAALEKETINFLAICCNTETFHDDSHIPLMLRSSKLVLKSNHSDHCFQTIINIMSNVWFGTHGHPFISKVLSTFAEIVESTCSLSTYVCLFPWRICDIALSMTLTPERSYCPGLTMWRQCVQNICRNTCTPKEIIILFVMYPKWQPLLLEDATDKGDYFARTLVRLLELDI